MKFCGKKIKGKNVDQLNNFYIFGFNYKANDIKKREEIIKKSPENYFEESFKKDSIKGYVVIKTCLRIEIYFYSLNFNADNLNNIINKKQFYLFHGIEAVNHLFNLSCGLDSIIIGENEILSQLKKAYFQHLNDKKTCPELNTVFNHAISVGKKFRHRSNINNTGISMEHIVIKYIKKIFPDLETRTIFLIGSGDIIRIILCSLKKECSARIILTSRTQHKLTKFIDDFSVESIKFKDKYLAIKESDIIISATSAPHFVITKNDAVKYISDKKKRLFIDLAVPRDIDENIIQIDGVTIYNLEDIFSESSINMDKRKVISVDYKYLIEEEMEKLLEWIKKRKKKLWIEKKSLLAQEEAS